MTFNPAAYLRKVRAQALAAGKCYVCRKRKRRKKNGRLLKTCRTCGARNRVSALASKYGFL